MDWTTPADLRAELKRQWDRGRLLTARLRPEPLFPLRLRLRKPGARELSQRFDEVRKWIRCLEEGSRARQGFGYEIEWAEIQHRELGRNRLPSGIVVPSEEDALKLLGKTREVDQFQHLVELTLQGCPELREWLAKKPLRVLEHARDWERILAVLLWFRDHPGPGLYLRQLDIAGVDTKFIEARKGLLSELLDRVLPAVAVAADTGGFEPRYGLLAKPPLIRFRLLDERYYLHGLSDLSTPAAQFARLSLPVERVFITENDINGLAFPDVDRSLIIFGLGYGVDRLAEIPWLKAKEVHYWGDIDTHGYAILDRLRAVFPDARSFLMDRETLQAHRPLWVQEHERHAALLGRLSAAERQLYDDLRYDRLGDRVRLEQERIAFGWLKRALTGLDGA